MATEGSSSSFLIGSRVNVLAKGVPAASGTIRFVGETAFAAGQWFGVELDEAAGKNDGSVQGKRYFECAPNYGLFVRVAQLQPLETEKSSTSSSDSSSESSSSLNNQQQSVTSPTPSSSTPSSSTPPSPTPPSIPPSSAPSSATPSSSTPSTPKTLTPSTSSSSSNLLPEIESEAVLNLTQSMLDSFTPTLMRITQQLAEIQQSQVSLFGTIDSEFAKLASNAESIRKIQEVFSRLPEYDNKAQRSLREIASINERMQKLKVQTKKLQTRKLKDDEEELRRVRKALEKEQQLLALPADERSKKV